MLKEGDSEKAVVLAHGYDQDLNEDQDYFITLSESLQEHGLCVYRFSFKQTTLSDEIEQLENRVQEVRNHHKKVFLVGQSTGGIVSAFQKVPVDYMVLTFPVVDARKTFDRLSETHVVPEKWLEDAEKYDLTGKRLDAFMFYSDKDEYIDLREYESVDCEKELLEGWCHGPSNQEQIRFLCERVALKLQR